MKTAIIQMLTKYWLYLFLTGVLIGALVAHNQKLLSLSAYSHESKSNKMKSATLNKRRSFIMILD